LTQVVKANGLEIAYERVGDGPPIVLVHGGGDDHRGWQPQLDALSEEFTLVAWDEPGSGGSADVPAGFGIADYARCLSALLEELAIGPAHVAGVSWGGTLALELYRQRPELVATLILADTYAGWKGSLPESEVHARVEASRRMLDGPRADFDPLFADARRQTLEALLPIMAETDQRDLLPRIAVPTLLIWGELDERSPLSVARQFERAIPDTTLVVIPQAGHLSNLDQPERFNDAMRSFCLALSA
jgi:pimeloyl-ACP methyl ester carboxylesterase